MGYQEENSMGADEITPGGRLRQARLEKNLELEQVAQKLRLSKQQVEAIENGDYSYVPRLAYVRGHLRLYAKLVGLEENEIIKTFEALGVKDTLGFPTIPPVLPYKSASTMQEKKSKLPKAIRWWSIGAVIILLGLGLLSFFGHTSHKEETATVAPKTVSAVVSGASIELGIPPQNAATTVSIAESKSSATPVKPDEKGMPRANDHSIE